MNELTKIEYISVIQWPEDKSKEKVKGLKGIESFYPERFFEDAMKEEEFKSVLTKDGNSNYKYSKGSSTEKLNNLKNFLSDKIKSELRKEDVEDIADFIKGLVKCQS